MDEEISTKKLNIYKLRQEVFDFDAPLIAPKNPAFDLESFFTEGNCDFKLYVQRNKTGQPHWYQMFQTRLRAVVVNHNSSFVLFVRVRRIDGVFLFALTGGNCSYSVIHRFIEEEFGLRIAERTISSVKNIAQTAFAGSDKQINRSVQAYNPSMDIESQRRILRSLKGKAANTNVGHYISGADSLSVRKKIELESLPDYFNDLINTYQSEDVLVSIPRTFREIKSLDEKEILNTIFIRLFNTLLNTENEEIEDNENFFVGYRNYDDLLKCERFTIGLGAHSTVIQNDLDISNVISFLRLRNLERVDFPLLKKIRIEGTGEEDFEEIIPSTPLHKFIYAEVPHDGKTFFYIDGKWYQITQTHKEYIDNELKKYVVVNYLPACNRATTPREEQYNAAIADADNDYVLLDQDLTTERIEICDLYKISESSFIHVKKGWGAKLSHLFAQGLVSASYFSSEQSFRDQCHVKTAEIPQSFTGGISKVVFAIVDRKTQTADFPRNMTYFSKVNLVEVASKIQSYGFNIQLCKCDLT